MGDLRDGFRSQALLGLVSFFHFIQGCGNLRVSESIVLDQKGVLPLGEKEVGLDGQSGEGEPRSAVL